MQTKVVELRNGSRLVLYMSEETGQWTSDKDSASDNFYKYIITGNTKQSKVIREYYYNQTIEYSRNKLKTMINEDSNNIKRAYDLVVCVLANREIKI